MYITINGTSTARADKVARNDEVTLYSLDFKFHMQTDHEIEATRPDRCSPSKEEGSHSTQQ